MLWKTSLSKLRRQLCKTFKGRRSVGSVVVFLQMKMVRNSWNQLLRFLDCRLCWRCLFFDLVVLVQLPVVGGNWALTIRVGQWTIFKTLEAVKWCGPMCTRFKRFHLCSWTLCLIRHGWCMNLHGLTGEQRAQQTLGRALKNAGRRTFRVIRSCFCSSLMLMEILFSLSLVILALLHQFSAIVNSISLTSGQSQWRQNSGVARGGSKSDHGNIGACNNDCQMAL